MRIWCMGGEDHHLYLMCLCFTADSSLCYIMCVNAINTDTHENFSHYDLKEKYKRKIEYSLQIPMARWDNVLKKYCNLTNE